MSHESYNSYRGYVKHLEHGTYVWCRSMGWSRAGTQPAGVRQSDGFIPTKMDRIVTTATDEAEAERQLDRVLDERKKKAPKEDHSGNLKLF